MMTIELDALQRSAVDAHFDRSVAIIGKAGSGKSTALRARAQRAIGLYPDAVVANAADAVADLAWSVLLEGAANANPLDDVDAIALFSEAAQPLLALEWAELADNGVDPEVGGLRSPERFLEAAFRLIGKLRDASMAPQEFLAKSLDGAANFYAKPPNFAHTELLSATKDVYRDSLAVTPDELTRQYRREIDLAKIIAHLYDAYLKLAHAYGCYTRWDAIATATERLKADASLLVTIQTRASALFLDDAQELTIGEIALLQCVFGESLAGVTFAGDADSATNMFRGARPDRMLAVSKERIELKGNYRTSKPAEIKTNRSKIHDDEVAYVAEQVAELLVARTAPSQIALIFRCVADVHSFERALLERDIPVQVAGDVNPFNNRHALDALALLWNVWDPFRHEWLLRTLGNPMLALSDASIATLCSEPNHQTDFFTPDDVVPGARSSRWDPKRDVRLGWNVIRGDQDASLNQTARTRLARFRELRASWLTALDTTPFVDFAIRVLNEGLARYGQMESAHALSQELALQRLLDRCENYFESNPGATLGDLLEYIEARAESATERCAAIDDDRFVSILSVDAARGREFDHVIVPNAKAGLFPRWYAPDAFLFSPKLGMIPKENAGDAKASRTAKFTYYMHRAKTRDRYNDEERRAFRYALGRARKTILVTASGRPTRGVTAPELLEELR